MWKFTVFLCLALYAKAEERNGKVLGGLFNVVTFPNDHCIITGGSKNGTCYTQEECSNKGGTNGGSCASGYGICCVFTLGCGGSSTENGTHFEVTGASDGPCNAKIYKASDDVVQMRLDFTSFVITGPNTVTTSVASALVSPKLGTGFAYTGSCLTDLFTVSDSHVPPLCGTLTGEHVYFDVAAESHNLDFHFGQTAIGTTKATRSFSIKVVQIMSSQRNKAPPGCTQWYTGATSATYIKSFNYDGGIKLANQRQVICVRREAGNCQTCYTAASLTDVQLGGKDTKGIIKTSLMWGTKGTKTTGTGDFIFIPNLTTVSGIAKPEFQAGGKGGLVTASGTTSKTVCTKALPFRLEWITDEINADGTVAGSTAGFKVSFFQNSC